MARQISSHDLVVALLLVQSALERRSEVFFKPFRLTSAQFNILNLLGHRADRMDQAELVDLLLVGKSSISIVLNRMVRNQLIKRQEHSRDRRQVVLALTPKGRALWRKIALRYEASVEKIFGALPSSQRPQFLEGLRVLHNAFLAGEESVEIKDRWSAHFSKGKPFP